MTTLLRKLSGHNVAWPGWHASHARSETYYILGGTALILDLEKNDRVRLDDAEGGQALHFASANDLVLTHQGALQQGQLDLIAPTLSHAQTSRLTKSGIMLADLSPQVTKEPQLELVAQTAGLLVLSAPAQTASTVWDTNFPGPLKVYVQRTHISGVGNDVPDPLTDVVLDHRIAGATGTAYEVKRGEFIQILDIEGRQCADFLAFPRRAIDQGIERFVDTTTTRTMVRGAYLNQVYSTSFMIKICSPWFRSCKTLAGVTTLLD